MKKIIFLMVGLFCFVFSSPAQDAGRDSIRIFIVQKQNDSVIGGEIGEDREYFYHDNGRVYKYFRSYQTALYHYMGKFYQKPDYKHYRHKRKKEKVVEDTCFISKYKTKNKPVYFVIDKEKEGVGTIVR